MKGRAYRDECSDAEWVMAQDLAGPDWRLLVTGEEAGRPTAEVAHEVLLRSWGQLTGWLAKERNFLHWRGRLEQDRKDWQAAANGHKDGHLLRNLRLDRALVWLAERGEDLAVGDRAFIRASLALREREQAARERLRRRVTLASLVATAVMAVLLVAALWARNEAEHQRQAAVVANTQAQARRNEALRTQSRFLADLSRQRTDAGDATTGILLALAGLPSDKGNSGRPHVAEAEYALYAAIQAHREKRILRGHTQLVISAAFSPDGQRVVTASADGTARLWDAGSGQEIAALQGHTRPVTSAAFSPDGQRVVTASWDGTARLWDAGSGQEIVTRAHA